MLLFREIYNDDSQHNNYYSMDEIELKKWTNTLRNAFNKAQATTDPISFYTNQRNLLDVIARFLLVLFECDEEGNTYMDKKIKLVKKELDKKMNKLVEMDKPRDKKLEKCDKMMKKKK
jgi:hypothetical protein